MVVLRPGVRMALSEYKGDLLFMGGEGVLSMRWIWASRFTYEEEGQVDFYSVILR